MTIIIRLDDGGDGNHFKLKYHQGNKEEEVRGVLSLEAANYTTLVLWYRLIIYKLFII